MESSVNGDKCRPVENELTISEEPDQSSLHIDKEDIDGTREISEAESTVLNDNSWIDELECALLADCDQVTLKKITEGRRVPSSLRYEFWKALLAITTSSKVTLTKEFNLENQFIIRQDCEKLVSELSCQSNISDANKIALLSNLESTLTTYIKARPELHYARDNGWVDILRVLYQLDLSDVQLYQMFLRIVDRYIPKKLTTNDNSSLKGSKEHNSQTKSIQSYNGGSQAYHLLRLLLLYHDPDLCSILDSKKVTPDLYAKNWLCSLFARCCSSIITLIIWDTHFKMADPFLIFFAAIVMVVNASEDLKNSNPSQQEMIDILERVPKGLQEDDIDDLYYLVSNHYANFTPRSIRAYSHIFFMDTFSNTYLGADSEGQHTLIDVKTNQLTQNLDLSQYLCLPIVPAEIVIPLNTNDSNNQHHGDSQCHESQQTKVAILKYFLVDCRPAEQYNAGHLTRAFHLDCSLMLREPSAFSTAVQALLDIQRQIIASGSQTGGQHLCFIGSGREEEDQYVNMVVASFLQKHQKYVSIVIGGFDAIHDFVNSKQELSSNFDRYIIDHNTDHCLACHATQARFSNNNLKNVSGNKGFSSAQSILATTTDFLKIYDRSTNLSSITASLSGNGSLSQSGSILANLSSAFASKSSIIRGKLESLTQPPSSSSAAAARHVSQNDKLGRRYTGQSRYSIDDDVIEVQSESSQEVQIDTWCKQDDIIASFKCSQIKNNVQFPGYIAISKTHLWILREIPHNKGFACVVAKRPLEMVVQITSKRRQPGSIIFRYGYSRKDEQNQPITPEIVAADHINIPQPFDLIRLVKQEVVRILDQVPPEKSG